MFWALLSHQESVQLYKTTNQPFHHSQYVQSLQVHQCMSTQMGMCTVIGAAIGLSVFTVQYTDDGPVRPETRRNLHIIVILTKCVCALINHILTIQYINSPQAGLGASGLRA